MSQIDKEAAKFVWENYLSEYTNKQGFVDINYADFKQTLRIYERAKD